MTNIANFTFVENLTDFLTKRQKNASIAYSFTGNPAVKDTIEAIGIPHVEVANIIINGSNAGFYSPINHNDNIQVCPIADSFNNSKANPLVPPIDLPIKFVADVHLGKLVKTLRMLGIDVLYENNYTDETIIEIAVKEQRVVLTRDVGLLKHKILPWGYWLRSQKTEEQTEEVIKRFGLTNQMEPFTRCLACNGLIAPVQKEKVLDKLPENTIKFFQEFYQCSCCKKVYWKGSHFERMEDFVKGITTVNKS